MIQQNKTYGVKGIYNIYKDKLLLDHMKELDPLGVAKERLRVIEFFELYGIKITIEAFKVSKPTIYSWRNKYHKSNKKIESLIPQSRTPKNKRQKTKRIDLENLIIELRKDIRISKEKIKRIGENRGMILPSSSTIGRLIKDLKNRGRIRKTNKVSYNGKTGKITEKKIRKQRKKERLHKYNKEIKHLLQIDCVIEIQNGIRRYVVNAIDTNTRMSFSYAYTNLSSLITTNFLNLINKVFPFPITHIQTDNGSEFEKLFHATLIKNNIIHFNTYPRSPKMNAFIERYNRTLQEEFLNSNKNTLTYDINTFNKKLMNYLQFYNFERPHISLDLEVPMSYYIKQLTPPSSLLSNMLWTDTLY